MWLFQTGTFIGIFSENPLVAPCPFIGWGAFLKKYSAGFFPLNLVYCTDVSNFSFRIGDVVTAFFSRVGNAYGIASGT